MKTRRLLSVFLLVMLLLSILTMPIAAAGTEEPVLPKDPDILAKAALLVDVESGAVAYAKNEHQELYPASLTKVMTALLVLDAIEDGKLSMDQEITASETAFAGLASDGSNAGIKAGEILTVRNLLYCMMVVSANEACNILAEAVSGSVEAFVAEMNTRANLIGCSDTKFANTNGLHNVEHYTTAWDMYLIAREAYTHEVFMRICSIKYFELPATETNRMRSFYTTNYLIDAHRNNNYLYSGAKGIKTGFTSDAGYCLIACAERNDRNLLSVVLGSERVDLENGTRDTRSFSETIKLLDYGFDQFSRQIILSSNELIDEIPVALSQQQNSVKLHPAQEIERLIPVDIDPAKDIRREVTFLYETVDAPVTKGQVLGSVKLSHGDTVYATVDLLADEDVSSSRILVFQRDAMLFLQKPVVKISAVAFVALILLIIILRFVLGRRRRRYGRGYSGNRSGGYRGRRR